MQFAQNLAPANNSDRSGTGQSGSFRVMPRDWQAKLKLEVELRHQHTRLTQNRSLGPLRVLRPYYPEGSERTHLYLLHPPGGLVCGDELNIEVNVKPGAKLLTTTPSAGKIYRSDKANHQQTQKVRCYCGDHAEFEWFPQETIVFDGANGLQEFSLHTSESSKFTGWEITALGRPASNLPFVSGKHVQSLKIFCNSRPLLVERICMENTDSMLEADWGLAGRPVIGTMFAGYFADNESARLLTGLREHLGHNIPAPEKSATQRPASDSSPCWSVTRKRNILLIRAMANQSEPIKQLFQSAWQYCRPHLMGCEPCFPRIWAT